MSALRALRAAIPILAAAAATALAAPARATVFVDAESRGGPCDDLRPAENAASPATPWCSLPRAIAAAPEGDTVVVRGGSYPELDLDGERARQALLTLRAQPGEEVTIDDLAVDDSSLLRFEGFRIPGDVRIREGSDRIAIVGCRLPGGRLLLSETTGSLLEGNVIHDIPAGMTGGATGIRLVHDRGAVVRGNRIERVHDDGIQVGDVADVVLEANVIRDVHPSGLGEHSDAIQILGAERLVIRGNDLRDVQFGLMFTDERADGVTIENNVISLTKGTGFKAEGEFGMADLRVVGNTWYGSEAPVSFRRDHPGAVVRNNIFESVDGLDGQPVVEYNLIAKPRSGVRYGAHAITRPPRFVDAAAGVFELAPTSPAIDAGTSDGATPLDRLGRDRDDDPHVANTGAGAAPWVDLGAYERQIPGQDGGTPAAPGPAPAPGAIARPLRARHVTVRRVGRRGRRVVLAVRFRRPAAAARARVTVHRLTRRRGARRVARRTVALRAGARRARVRIVVRRRAGAHRVGVRLAPAGGRFGPAVTRRIRLRQGR